jgi:intracellular multiplication protein IcmP
MPAAPQDQQQNEQSLSPLWVALGIFVALFVIWHFGHAYISALVIKLKLFEVQLLGLFTNSLQTQLLWLKTVNPANVQPIDIATIAQITGSYLRFPVLIVLGVLGILLLLGNSVSNYKTIYSMQSLLEEEKSNWPQIAPVVTLDLVKQDIENGEWYRCMTTNIFAKKHVFLVQQKYQNQEHSLSHKRKLSYAVLKDDAAKVFALQLGRYWTSADELNIHTKALFAIFAAKANHDRNAVNAMLNQIAASAIGGKPDFTGVQEMLDKYKNTKSVQKVVSKHAYILTAMASLLELSRKDGVLATAEFLWLKPIDRKLWYMLNNVGRQTAFIEVAGPYAHWLAERAIGHKLLMPMIEPAINGFEIAIKEFAFTAEED